MKLLPLCLLLSLPAAGAVAATGGSDASLEGAEKLYREGQYAQAIAAAEKATDPRSLAAREFLLAGAYAKMQAFDQALPHYQRAEAAGASAPSLPYDYGQALFAAHQLPEAEAQFKRSIVRKFKVAASAYYVGYIRQIEENYPGAKDFYQRIQRLPEDPDKVKQAALVQLAEIELERARAITNPDRRRDALRMEVLPLFVAARDYERGTPSSEQARARITELGPEITPPIERMANGIPLPMKAYSLRVAQDFAYDSNVITLADDTLVQVSGKDSLVSRTSLLGRYEFDWRRRFSFTPELYLSGTFHSRRESPRVYQNDNFNFAPALRTKYEHVSRGQPATALLDVEWNYMLRDWRQAHQFPFYSRYWNFSLGERVKWLDCGTTTLRADVKFYENYDPARNAISPAVSLQQNVRIFGFYDLQNTLTADFLRARDSTWDERNYRLRQAVTFTRLFERVDVTPSLALQLKDTREQSPIRGTEFLVNPSLDLSREIARNWEGTFEYAFSKNFSKSKDLYQYTKHEVHVGLAYNL